MPMSGISTEQADFVAPETQVLEIARKMRDRRLVGVVLPGDLLEVLATKPRAAPHAIPRSSG